MKKEVQKVLTWNYGSRADARDATVRHHGPFSFISYLKYKARRGSSGDILDLYMFGLLFNCTVTVIDSETFKETRMAHSKALNVMQTETFTAADGESQEHLRIPTVDCVLLQSPYGHLTPCGKCGEAHSGGILEGRLTG